jgi:hypothetical protein
MNILSGRAMRQTKWIAAFLAVVFLWTGDIRASAEPSIFSAEGFFNTVSRIAAKSVPQISTLISQSYPEFPSDITALVNRKYPALRNDIYVFLNREYPGIYKEAVKIVRREAPATFMDHLREIKRRKKEIIERRIRPSDLLWERLEKNQPLKLRVMTEIDKNHPGIKYEILSHIDKHYPALKVDLFNLILKQYPNLVIDVAKIASMETLNEFRDL